MITTETPVPPSVSKIMSSLMIASLPAASVILQKTYFMPSPEESVQVLVVPFVPIKVIGLLQASGLSLAKLKVWV